MTRLRFKLLHVSVKFYPASRESLKMAVQPMSHVMRLDDWTAYDPCHEIMVVFVLHKLILQRACAAI